MTPFVQDRRKLLLAVALLGLVSGLVLWAAGRPELAAIAWAAGVAPVLAALLVEIVRSLSKGEVGLDIVAALSMSAALVFGETLAAAVVALMYSGGTFLESFAEGRARREMSDLLSRVPRTATRRRGGALEEVPLDDIAPGDLLLIRQGDVAPVDGTVESDRAMLDQSALTGESMPVRLDRGQDVMSGSTNAGEAFELRVSRRAADSTYAGIVRLVEAAQASKAPMSRLADRYSLLFLAVTVTLATAAWWFTGDPIRAVAVLVVATPCPLILAVPVALVAGLSRAAHFGVLIKGAKPLEALARDPHADPRQDRHADRRAPADRCRRHARRSLRKTRCCASRRRSTRRRSTRSRRRSSRRRARGASTSRSPRTSSRPRARASPGPSTAAGSWWAARTSWRRRSGRRPWTRGSGTQARSWWRLPWTGSSRATSSWPTPCGRAPPASSPGCGDWASAASCWRPATVAPWPRR